MNPHHLFLAITLFSIAITMASLAQSDGADGIYNMAMLLGITGASVGFVLYATRKYWRNARRLA